MSGFLILKEAAFKCEKFVIVSNRIVRTRVGIEKLEGNLILKVLFDISEI